MRLFWVFESFEKKLKFVGGELLTAFSVELLSESIELAAQKRDFSLKSCDALVFFVGGFDEVSLASFLQTTR